MLKEITDDLVADLEQLSFAPPTAYVYNPLVYARAPWDIYCERYGQGRREVILLGMNPGPFGMAQVGLPFGEVAACKEFLGIEAPVGKPPREHPKRPVLGFDCPRSEVSGKRFWGWAQERFGTPEAFFQRFFVANYCPLVFMEDGGRNRVPEKLPKAERELMFAACDRALARTLEAMQPRFAVGVGKFAEDRLRAVAEARGLDVTVGRILHPSPANPKANKGWAAQADRELEALGIR